MIDRRVIEPFEVGGYTFPVDSIVIVSPWVVQRDARFFPDPERFDPIAGLLQRGSRDRSSAIFLSAREPAAASASRSPGWKALSSSPPLRASGPSISFPDIRFALSRRSCSGPDTA